MFGVRSNKDEGFGRRREKKKKMCVPGFMPRGLFDLLYAFAVRFAIILFFTCW